MRPLLAALVFLAAAPALAQPADSLAAALGALGLPAAPATLLSPAPLSAACPADLGPTLALGRGVVVYGVADGCAYVRADSLFGFVPASAVPPLVLSEHARAAERVAPWRRPAFAPAPEPEPVDCSKLPRALPPWKVPAECRDR